MDSVPGQGTKILYVHNVGEEKKTVAAHKLLEGLNGFTPCLKS